MDDSQNKKKIEEILIKNQNSVQLHPIGYSMYPLIVPDRDEVIISPLKKKIRRGDVLLFRRKSGKLVLHRVIKVKESKLYFVGDNQTEIEGPIDPSQVLGIMSSFIHKKTKYSVSNPLYFLSWQIWLILLPLRKPISLFIHKIKSQK